MTPSHRHLSAQDRLGQFEQREPDAVVERLAESIVGDRRTRHIDTAFLPDRQAVLETLERLNWLMFPGFFGPRDISESELRDHVQKLLGQIAHLLQTQIAGALRYAQDIESSKQGIHGNRSDCETRAEQATRAFLARLSEIRRQLSLDVQAAYDGDPAAHHTDEVIFCYPGLRALAVHRLAHELYRLDVPLLPRIMSEHAHSLTGIDIHPGASIGRSFFIDHGTGVVIGETTVIGDHCKIYQGVTLGAKSFPKDERGRLKRGIKRHPTLEDHVTVYAGATILGGDTVIGAGSVVNGGVFLTQSVPPGSVIGGPKVETKVRNNPDSPPGNWAI
jgi:serine O-acetyltransferase